MKYRLNIKYPIEENIQHIFIKCVYFNNQEVEKFADFEHPVFGKSANVRLPDKKVFPVPKSWIDEIKGNSFTEYMKSDHGGCDWENCKDFEPIDMELCWQASQENRDLLYKDLMTHCNNHLEHAHDKSNIGIGRFYECFVGSIKKINKELDKGNVQG